MRNRTRERIIAYCKNFLRLVNSRNNYVGWMVSGWPSSLTSPTSGIGLDVRDITALQLMLSTESSRSEWLRSSKYVNQNRGNVAHDACCVILEISRGETALAKASAQGYTEIKMALISASDQCS